MIELLTNAETAEADRLAIAGGVAGIDLMESAGKAVAAAADHYQPGGRAVVVAGLGNNGGDGFVAARHLAERGYDAKVLLVGETAQLKGDAALAARHRSAGARASVFRSRAKMMMWMKNTWPGAAGSGLPW